GDLAHGAVALDRTRANVGADAFEHLQRLGEVAAANSEGEVGGAVMTDVLDDHVDVDVGVGDRPQDLVGDARLVGHAGDGELGFVAREGDAGDDGLFHVLVFLNGDERALAFAIFEAGEDAQLDLVLACEFDRADLQDLRAEAGHLQHLLEGDGVELAGFGDDARIGGVDAIDVGIDLALVGFQRRSQRHAGGVGAATAERGDVAVLVHTLEACNDHDLAFVEVATHWRVINI